MGLHTWVGVPTASSTLDCTRLAFGEVAVAFAAASLVRAALKDSP
jgi:hypothetical protein